MLHLDLQMFAEGEAAGVDSAAGSAAPQMTEAPQEQTQPTVEMVADDALQKYRQKRAAEGKRIYDDAAPALQAPAVPTEAAPPQEPERPASAEATAPIDKAKAYEELIKGEYKDEHKAWFESALNARLKNSKQAQEELKQANSALERLAPALEVLYQQRGIEAGDLDALVDSITNDNALFEEEALQRGIPVDTLKDMKALEREANALKAREAERAEAAMHERHLQNLVMQAEKVKQLYPGFDLRSELNNPEFFRLTSPNVGIDVQTAYEVIHRNELQPAMAAAVAQKTAENMAKSIQSASKRPLENGVVGTGNSTALSDDPANWTREQRDRAVAAIKAGKRPF